MVENDRVTAAAVLKRLYELLQRRAVVDILSGIEGEWY